jgi:hypothetical protein
VELALRPASIAGRRETSIAAAREEGGSAEVGTIEGVEDAGMFWENAKERLQSGRRSSQSAGVSIVPLTHRISPRRPLLG